MSASTKFNPGDYLKGLGWKGEGTGLHEGSRAKPVTVAKKTSLSGLGKDRDVAFPWWEMVFKNVAGKVGQAQDKKPDDPHHRTTTGIISPLPPRPKADEYAAASNGGGINLDAFAAAKIEQARRQLYAGFLRGKVVGGTAEEQIKKELEEAKAVLEGEAEGQTKRRKSGRSEASLEAKRIRKAIRAAKRERRALESGSATPITGTEGEDSDAFVVVGSADTPLGDDSSASTPALVVELSKADRKALKKAKRALDLDLTSSSESTSSKRRKTAESTPQHLSPEEELNAEEVAYKEARSIARQAEKEEKRLRKVVKRALKEQKEASV